MSKIFKLALILGVFTSIATVAVAAINTITAPIIQENFNTLFNETVAEMFPTGVVGAIYENGGPFDNRVIRVLDGEGGSALGFIYEQQVIGWAGPIIYLVAVDLDGNFLAFTSLAHSETAGIGTVIDEPIWEEMLRATHASERVDNVAGATDTVQPIADALQTIYQDLQNRR